ncbi:cytochrome c-type biogenesis protein CcmE [Cyclonatronum proteinivorum]|uniref:Cytochrome c-type biogenesis protein CcmE n=1 Tax=Cyclonatronum proteinivorum TaxID=1457365 RepID=A0A345ULZ8_9BACT|nr:cytochrome c maturation protein CcmE [Cyclonatronum proteinivorum]AXJ01500.1 cytochrome c-type biogenesis protein CcmE [Cyclonatronum proteinivorum]
MKPRVIIGTVAIVLFTSLLMWNFGNSLGSYVGFEDAELSGNRVHVIGTWVPDKPHGFDNQRMVFNFYMEDNYGQVRRVSYNKPKPNNFEDAESLVVVGKMRNGVMLSDDMLVKCPSKYNDASNLEMVNL